MEKINNWYPTDLNCWVCPVYETCGYALSPFEQKLITKPRFCPRQEMKKKKYTINRTKGGRIK
jgi:hypothetical protein